LTASNAQGFVICTPDTRLGPAIVAKAKAGNLRVMAVDDQFIGADGKPMANVPYLGISARQIGTDVGTALLAESKKRGWSAADTAVCVMALDELATARERTEGAIEVLAAGGFSRENIFRAQMRASDIPGAFDAANALFARERKARHWLVCGMNDNTVLGAVRALEGLGVGAEDAIAIGIGGSDCIGELRREKQTAFFGSILLTPKRHGCETAAAMFKWIKEGVEPPLDTRTSGVLMTRENFVALLNEQ
ncbi:MAG: substrate-binding domain-containing protein, partial [Opitutaceae bacterium]